MEKVYQESAQLLSQLPNPKSNNLPRRVAYENVEHTLRQTVELLDTVMFIPIGEKQQIHITIYKLIKDKSLVLDIRKYKLISNKWRPLNGIQIPFSYLEQLTIRLNALNRKHNKRILDL